MSFDSELMRIAGISGIVACSSLCISLPSILRAFSETRRSLDAGALRRQSVSTTADIQAPFLCTTADPENPHGYYAGANGRVTDDGREAGVPRMAVVFPPWITRWTLAISGLWWNRLPGYSKSLVLRTSLPSYLAALNLIVFGIIVLSNGGEFDSQFLFSLWIPALVFIPCISYGRYLFVETGWLFFAHMPFVPTSGREKDRRILRVYCLVNVFLAAVFAFDFVSDYIFNPSPWRVIYAVTFFLLFFLIVLSSLMCMVPFTFAGRVYSNMIKVLRMDIGLVARGQSAVALQDLRTCARFYALLTDSMSRTSPKISGLAVPAVSLVLYMYSLALLDIIRRSFFFSSLFVALIASLFIIWCLYPAALVNYEVEKLRSELACMLLDADDRRGASSQCFDEKSELFSASGPSSSSSFSKYEFQALTEQDRKLLRDMFLVSGDERRSSLLFYGKAVTRSVLVRGLYIIFSIMLFLLQDAAFRS
eukprot:ANDGO_01517.mRNA.1 hypothetical protein